MTLPCIVRISAVQADSRYLTRCRAGCFRRRVGVLILRLLAELRLTCSTMGGGFLSGAGAHAYSRKLRQAIVGRRYRLPDDARL